MPGDPRYEPLLRAGGDAFLAGFPAEAIRWLSAALDRACEIYVRAVCRDEGLDPGQIDAAWGIGPDAARQLGAFSIVFLLDTGTALPPDPGMMSLRDRAFHNARGVRRSSALGPLAARPVAGSRASGPLESVGRSRRIRKENEAREFGEYVFSRLRAIERALERHPASLAAEGEDGPAAEPLRSFDDYLESIRPTRDA